MKINRKWTRPILITVGSIALICTVSVASFLGYLYVKAGRTIDKVAAPPKTSNNKPADGKDNTAKDDTQDNKERPLLFMLTAIDHRPGSDGSLNTDVIMLMAWDPKTKQITMLSVPRDMKMQPAGFNPHKANYYYAYYYNRDKDTAMSNAKELYSDYFDLPIDYMAIINFEGFRDLIDLLGGATVDVEMNMRYVDPTDGTDINLKKGLQVLDGKQTLDYLRYRKSNFGTAESTDAQRNERQQLVFKQIIDKLTSFSGITKFDDLLDIVGDNLKTDIPANVLRYWIFNAGKLKPNHFETLQVDSDWISPYIYVNEEQWADALQQLREIVAPTEDTLLP